MRGPSATIDQEQFVRIVAGKYRRRKLLARPGRSTRPITDRAKEHLFEFLERELAGRRVADVFAGTGTLGLEALSRGAASVVFIEHDRLAVERLRRNVAVVAADADTLCWRADVLRCSFRPKGAERFLPYDVVFFDPPYRMIGQLRAGTVLFRALSRLSRDGVTSPECLLLVRAPERATFEVPAVWTFDRVLSISSMEIHWFRKRAAFAEGSPASGSEGESSA